MSKYITSSPINNIDTTPVVLKERKGGHTELLVSINAHIVMREAGGRGGRRWWEWTADV